MAIDPVWGQGPTFSCACFFLADQRRDLGLADAPSGVHARLNRIGHLLHSLDEGMKGVAHVRSNPKKFKLFSGSASSTTEGLHHHGVVVADLASA